MFSKRKNNVQKPTTTKIKAGVSGRKPPLCRPHLRNVTASTMSRLCFFSQSSTKTKKVKATEKRVVGLSTFYKRKVAVLGHVTQDIKRTIAGKRPAHHQLFNVHLLIKSSTFWGLRMLAFRQLRNKRLISVRVRNHRGFAGTPHTGLTRVSHYTPHIYDVSNAYKSVRKILWIFFRMRFERFMFKALGCRVYCWFSNLWNTMRGDLVKWQMFEHFAILRLIKKGMRFTIRENHARVFLKSALLAVSVVGGLSVFMQMLSRMVQTFRSHWAVVMYSLRLFDNCRCFFWYKVLVQYRMTVRGKFGGHMRASQKMFQHGLVKLGAWSLDVGYYRIRPITKYGTFSLRFWLQFRDIRRTRMIGIMTKKGKPAHKLPEHNLWFPAQI